MPIHPAQKAQIALLVAEDVKIPIKYSDFLDVFLEERASILLKAINLNQHAIELQEGQQTSYMWIIRILITSQSRTNIHYFLLVNY